MSGNVRRGQRAAGATKASTSSTDPCRRLRLAPQHVAARGARPGLVAHAAGLRARRGGADGAQAPSRPAAARVPTRRRRSATRSTTHRGREHQPDEGPRGRAVAAPAPPDAPLGLAVSVREENIVGAVRDAAWPTTQLTARACPSSPTHDGADGRSAARPARDARKRRAATRCLFGRRVRRRARQRRVHAFRRRRAAPEQLLPSGAQGELAVR